MTDFTRYDPDLVSPVDMEKQTGDKLLFEAYLSNALEEANDETGLSDLEQAMADWLDSTGDEVTIRFTFTLDDILNYIIDIKALFHEPANTLPLGDKPFFERFRKELMELVARIDDLKYKDVETDHA